MKITLKGGSRDGEMVEILINSGRPQPVIHMAKRISIDESRGLAIDENVTWKSPEEVYELIDGEYVYKRTVYYKPIVG